jgi:hypothetical protein
MAEQRHVLVTLSHQVLRISGPSRAATLDLHDKRAELLEWLKAAARS